MSSILRSIISDIGHNELFRQTRYEEKSQFLRLHIGTHSYQVTNYSRTGLAFQATKEASFDISQSIEDIKIKFSDDEVFSGSINIKSVTNEGESILIGAMFMKTVFPTEKLIAAQAKNDLLKQIDVEMKELQEVNKEACKLIIDCARFLQMFTDKCEAFEKQLIGKTYDSCQSAEAAFMEYMAPVATDYLVEFNAKFSSIIDVDSIMEGSAYHRIFGQLIYPFFDGSDLARRAKDKPLGYAGDFEMMNQIYRNGYEGKTLVGKILHNYVANEKSSESVSFRKPYFLSYYEKSLEEAKGNDINILSLASGPCVEFQNAIEKYDQETLSKINLTLFDLDQVSLEHAQTKIYEKSIEQQKSINIEFINASVKLFIESSNQKNTEYYDLVYSGGLFDYLDNATSTAIVTNLFNFIKPGGRVIIGNFTQKNSTKAFCHFVTNWHLIHKTEEEMRAWTKYLPKNSYHLKIDYDDNGINAFLVLEKPRE